MSLVSGHPLALGPLSSDRFILDPKTFSFFLSRYKFAGKMLSRCRRIADIGCGDGTGDVMLLKETNANILAYDLDKEQIDYANKTLLPVLHKVIPHDANRLAVEYLDFTIDGPLCPSVDGLVSLDVIEHISPDDEDIFFHDNVDVINGDILKMDFRLLCDRNSIILGNLPYNISSQIIFNLLESGIEYEYAVFLIQKELADRFMPKEHKSNKD